MAKQKLESVFEAMYHGKFDFKDFISGPTSELYKTIKFKNRTVYDADKKLKAYHKFLNLFLFEFLELNTRVVYSYRKGVNVIDAVKKHASSRHFFQTDLKNFFGSIDLDMIRAAIQENTENFPVSDVNENIERILELVSVSGVLPPGFATSPLISNACLYHFDNQVEKFCLNSGLIYTRYSDDIIISGSTNKLYGLDAHIESMLKESFGEKVLINGSKSKYTSIGGKIKILGVVILPGGGITIDTKLKSKIEVLLHYFTSDRQKFNVMLDDKDVNGLLKVSGYLNYINTTDPAYLNKLRTKYGATVVDMFMRGSVK
ncbi:reverse transcriptase domain-containing protein [Pseudomonas fluorescens group sp. PF-1]